MSKTRGSLPSWYWRSYSETSSAGRSLTGRIQAPTTPAFNSRPATHRPCIFRELAKHTIRFVMLICRRQPSRNAPASMRAQLHTRDLGAAYHRCAIFLASIDLLFSLPDAQRQVRQIPRPTPIVPRIGSLDSRRHPGRQGFCMYRETLVFVSCFTKRRRLQNGGNDRARARCMWRSAGERTGSNVGRNAERSTDWDQTGTKSQRPKSCVFSEPHS